LGFDDFRSFLSCLETDGDLVRVKKSVSPKFEIAAGMRKTSNIDGPALLFENVEGSEIPVAAALFCSRRRAYKALGTTRDAYIEKFVNAIKNPIKPRIVDDALCKEVILTGDDADLSKLPICTHCRLDAAPFITMGMQFAEDPDYGRNIGIYRMHVYDGKTAAIGIGPPQHGGVFYAKAEAKNEPLPVAVVLGTDPSLIFASQVKGPLGLDETEIAGGINREPIELVKCETIDVAVPASAEIVLEGEVIPKERMENGPFGEYMGYYSALPSPVWKLKAITHRKDPIYLAGLSGLPFPGVTDNHVLREISSEAVLYDRVKSVCPSVKSVCFTQGSGMTRHAIISLRPAYKGESKQVLLSALSFAPYIRQVIVVDEDVDPFEPIQVEWAMAHRFNAQRDILISHSGFGESPQMGIDATRSFGKPLPSSIPGQQTLNEVTDEVGVEEFEIPMGEWAKRKV
jgi:4-hydroxy-3-polyprenylbenzoate decarboxylase/2,5-furandicarboxylate decarboxylase 1